MYDNVSILIYSYLDSLVYKRTFINYKKIIKLQSLHLKFSKRF